jgi:phosphoribosylglycinamide formyltransferase-1
LLEGLISMKHILFLASGGGGNFKFFHSAIEKNIISDISISIVADRDCGAIAFAKRMGLQNSIIPYSRERPEAFQQFLNQTQPDFIVTNWHKIIDATTVQQHQGKFVNLHYSLLPAFSGLLGIEPIKKAYEQGCKYIGPTCHLVDSGIDTGKILAQGIFTTARPLDESIAMMFRTGCLTLLNGLMILINQHDHPENENIAPSFSPHLTLDSSFFDHTFWQELSNR